MRLLTSPPFITNEMGLCLLMWTFPYIIKCNIRRHHSTFNMMRPLESPPYSLMRLIRSPPIYQQELHIIIVRLITGPPYDYGHTYKKSSI